MITFLIVAVGVAVVTIEATEFAAKVYHDRQTIVELQNKVDSLEKERQVIKLPLYELRNYSVYVQGNKVCFEAAHLDAGDVGKLMKFLKLER